MSKDYPSNLTRDQYELLSDLLPAAKPGGRPRRCGVVGEWQLEGDCAPLLPWLWLGQWLHVGKNATMGMGQYRLLWD